MFVVSVVMYDAGPMPFPAMLVYYKKGRGLHTTLTTCLHCARKMSRNKADAVKQEYIASDMTLRVPTGLVRVQTVEEAALWND